jgi:hypothetical protein
LPLVGSALPPGSEGGGCICCRGGTYRFLGAQTPSNEFASRLLTGHDAWTGSGLSFGRPPTGQEVAGVLATALRQIRKAVDAKLVDGSISTIRTCTCMFRLPNKSRFNPVRFRYYSGCATCSPSRAGLDTWWEDGIVEKKISGAGRRSKEY